MKKILILILVFIAMISVNGVSQNYIVSSFSFYNNVTTGTGNSELPYISSDGTKIFQIDAGSDDIYAYNLTTPFELNSIVSPATIFDLTPYETVVNGFVFGNNGTEMFILGNGKIIKQFHLSTAWDISTASNTKNSTSLTTLIGVIGFPRAMDFKDDGTKMYFIEHNDIIYELNLSTAWDISTLSYNNKSITIQNMSGSTAGIVFVNGSILLGLTDTGDKIYQFPLSTAWDISTLSSSTANLYVGTKDTNPVGIAVSSNRSKIYYLGGISDNFYQYNEVIDTLGPEITSISMNDTTLTVGETSLLTIVFNEVVYNFTNTDITTIESGTLSAVSSSNNITWTSTFTPTASLTDLTNVITVTKTGLNDVYQNAGTGTNSTANYIVDTSRPEITSISMNDTTLIAGETSLLTIIFSEAVYNFSNTDITTIESGTLSAVSSSNNITWTSTFTPTASVTDLTNVITVTKTGLNDVYQNAGTGTNSTANYEILSVNLENISISLISLLNGNQSGNISFDISNPGNLTISTCNVLIGSTLSNGTLTGSSCAINFTTALNSTVQVITPTVYDNTSTSYTGTANSSLSIAYISKNLNTSLYHNLTTQYFVDNYTLTNPWGSTFLNIDFSLNSSDSIQVINVSSSTNISNQVEDDIIVEDTYYTIPGTSFTYGTNYPVYRTFNITNPYNITISNMILNLSILSYNSSLAFNYTNGTAKNYTDYSSYILTTLDNISYLGTQKFNLSYNSNVILRSLNVATYTIVSIDGVYLKHYNFTPQAQYYSNFTNFTGTITDSLATATYFQNWNTKLNWITAMTWNGSTQVHTATDNSNLLAISFNTTDLSIPVYFQLDYYVTHTDFASVGGGGGGGGGGTTIINVIGNDADKVLCEIIATPKEIILTEDTLFLELSILNREDFNIDPKFSFVHVTGDEALTNQLRITNTVSNIDGSKSQSIGIKLNSLSKGKAEASLVISTTKCKNVLVPIEINITKSSNVEQIFSNIEEKSIDMILSESFDEVFLGSKSTKENLTIIDKIAITINSVGGITMLLSFVVLLILLPVGKYRKIFPNTFWDYMARIILLIIAIAFIYILAKVGAFFLAS